jgi:hypothetical protein
MGQGVVKGVRFRAMEVGFMAAYAGTQANQMGGRRPALPLRQQNVPAGKKLLANEIGIKARAKAIETWQFPRDGFRTRARASVGATCM